MRVRVLSLLTAALLIPAMSLIAQAPEEPREPEAAQLQTDTSAQPVEPEASAVESEAQEPSAVASETEQVSASNETIAPTEAEGQELPKTASPLALLALIGVGGVGSAFSLRKLRS